MTQSAYVEVRRDQHGEGAGDAFLQRAVAWFAARPVAVRRVPSDNGLDYYRPWSRLQRAA